MEAHEATGPEDVQLPVQRAHRRGLAPAPVLDGSLHRQSLLDLREVDEVREVEGQPELLGHPGEDGGIATGLRWWCSIMGRSD